MRGPPWKSLGLLWRVTNKGESGLGKASDRVKAEDHRPSGIFGEVWWGALSSRSKIRSSYSCRSRPTFFIFFLAQTQGISEIQPHFLVHIRIECSRLNIVADSRYNLINTKVSN